MTGVLEWADASGERHNQGRHVSVPKHAMNLGYDGLTSFK